MVRKDLIIAVLLTFCLTVTLFTVLSTMGQVPEYDIWLDFNDDGKIDMRDIGVVARAFGANGQPINKTFVLLETLNAVTALNMTMQARLPERNVISIPAAAFMPYFDDYEEAQRARVHGRFLSNYDTTQSGYYNAPVQLPHGVNVTRVYIFWYDVGVGSVEGRLIKAAANHTLTGYWELAYLESPLKDGPGWGSSNTNIIEDSVIDNYYQYYVNVRIPPSASILLPDYYFYYAIIEYEYPE